MKRIMLVFLLLILLAPNANSALYTYDFSAMGFIDAQNLEGMIIDSATFTSETNDLRYYTNYGAGIGTGLSYGSAGDIYVSFMQPINSLSIRAGDGAGDNDAYEVLLYAFGTDAYLGTYSTPVFGGVNEPEWYTLNISVSNVGRIVFDPGNAGVLPGVAANQGGVVITDMSYNTASAVPEPATILLLGAGLIGLAGFGRKKFR